jgi:hypothetical protein
VPWLLLVVALGGCDLVFPVGGAPDPEAGLVLYLPLDGDLIDASGNQHDADCIVTCPEPGGGRVDSGLIFNGVSTHAYVPYHPDLDLPQAFTIAVWLAVGDQIWSGTAVNRPVGTMTGSSMTIFVVAGGGQVGFQTSDQQDELTAAISGGWHHVAASWNGTEKALYLDGLRVAATIVPSIAFDNHDFYLGTDNDNGVLNERLVGTLDELRLYDRALTEAEINALPGFPL